MINLHAHEADFLRSLLAQRVRFVIVGGRAVNFYGHLRIAPDLDLFYSETCDNPSRLLDTLGSFGGGHLTLNSLVAIVQVNIMGCPIQLHPHIDGVSFDEAYADAVFAPFAHVGLPFISCKHLLENKRVSGTKPDRAKDLDDVAALRERCRPET